MDYGMIRCSLILALVLTCLALTGCDDANVYVPGDPPEQSAALRMPIEPWVTNAQYGINDVVSFEGQTFVSVRSTDGTQAPTDTAYWKVVNSGGSAEDQGISSGLVDTQGVSSDKMVPMVLMAPMGLVELMVQTALMV